MFWYLDTHLFCFLLTHAHTHTLSHSYTYAHKLLLYIHNILTHTLTLTLTHTHTYAHARMHMLTQPGEPYTDSLAKFEAILQLCVRLGVHTTLRRVDDVWIVPLFAWYSPTFANTPSRTWDGDREYRRGWLDFRRLVTLW
jgi:hypothetical protein